MLAEHPEDAARISRSDLGRLLLAALLLVVVVGAILGASFLPAPARLAVGDLVPADIRAPRALTFTSDLQTKAARSAARTGVEPQYDYSSERAIAIAAEQLDAFRRGVTPLETAFSPETDEVTRQALLQLAIPQLSEDVRSTLLALTV